MIGFIFRDMPQCMRLGANDIIYDDTMTAYRIKTVLYNLTSCDHSNKVPRFIIYYTSTENWRVMDCDQVYMVNDAGNYISMCYFCSANKAMTIII